MSSEKDFEKLLDDFINSSCVSTAVGRATVNESIKYKNCICNEVKYRIPAAPRKPQYRFASIKVSYNGNEINSECDGRLLVEPECPPCRLLVDFSDVEPNENIRKEHDIVMALYRERVAEPLSVRTVDSDSTGGCIWSDEEQSLEPGKYFILVSNVEAIPSEKEHFDTVGGSLRYCFQILPHGSKLKHPVVELEEFTCFKELILNVKETSGRERDVYGLYIYNSVGRLMERTDVMSEFPEHTGRFLQIVDTKEWWLDDRYTLVLTHNEQPFAAYSFDWANDAASSAVEETVRGRDFFEMAKQTKSRKEWGDFTKCPGYSAVRQGVLDFLTEKKNGGGLRCAICSETLRYDKEAMKLVSLNINPGHRYSGFNCVDLDDDIEKLASELESNNTVCLHRLSLLLTENRSLLSDVEDLLEEYPDAPLILFGNSQELERLFELSPVLARFIPEKNRWRVLPFTLPEFVDEFRNQIHLVGLEISNAACKALAAELACKEHALRGWGKKDIADCVETEFIPRFKKRVLESSVRFFDKSFFVTLEDEDVCLPDALGREDEVETSLAELNAMVGLSELKKSLMTTFNHTRFEEKRRRFGLAVPERGGHHMIFTGNPGTGKTTVAKLVGRVFHSMGLLSKGEVIEAERSKIVGRYIGETEQNMNELLEDAKGNVLFIDEAYSLCDNSDGDRKDFGCRVLECLLTVLSQKNPDMIVILAGYEKDMQQMLELNPGMKGRFPYKFNFEDYSAEELYRIALNLLNRFEYVLTPEADALLRETVCEAVAHKDEYFHNARWVEQYVWDGVVSAMSDRVMSMTLKVENKTLFQTIEAEDVRVAYRKMCPQTAAAAIRRIGFVA